MVVKEDFSLVLKGIKFNVKTFDLIAFHDDMDWFGLKFILKDGYSFKHYLSLVCWLELKDKILNASDSQAVLDAAKIKADRAEEIYKESMEKLKGNYLTFTFEKFMKDEYGVNFIDCGENYGISKGLSSYVVFGTDRVMSFITYVCTNPKAGVHLSNAVDEVKKVLDSLDKFCEVLDDFMIKVHEI